MVCARSTTPDRRPVSRAFRIDKVSHLFKNQSLPILSRARTVFRRGTSCHVNGSSEKIVEHRSRYPFFCDAFHPPTRKEKKEKEGNSGNLPSIYPRSNPFNARLCSCFETIFLTLINKRKKGSEKESERVSECTIPIIFECIIVRSILPRSPDQATLNPTYC